MGSAHLPPDRIGRPGALTSTIVGAELHVEEASRWLLDTPGETSGDALGWEQEHATILSETSWARDDEQRAALTARILLVDDNADMRDYLQRLLRQYYTVEAVATGSEALAAAREQLPDLVLSDVMMPGLDGFEFLQALRADPRTETVPVILLSARSGEDASIKGLQAGANDYLVKPFSARELLARVRARLEISQMHRASLNREREHAMSQQKLADENALLYQQAQEAVRDRDNLLSMVSHDLKNPLTAIKGYTQLLKRSVDKLHLPEKEALATGVTRIEATAVRMTTIIDELLDLAQLHIGQSLVLKRESVDLVTLSQQIVREQQHTTLLHSLQLEAEVPELVGQFDPARLERVLTNLISNAIKYDPKGKPINIRVSQEERDGSSYAILEVRDHGIGIPTSDQPHIFEQFHRAGNVVSSMRGTGVGLASVRQIVELHGGTIHVTSQEGQGSTFTVRLPLHVDASSEKSGIVSG
jgi:signal transduction histidine kinase